MFNKQFWDSECQKNTKRHKKNNFHISGASEQNLVNTFAASSAPAQDRLIDLTLEGHGPAANALILLHEYGCQTLV